MENKILESLATLTPVMAEVSLIVMALVQITKQFKVAKRFLPLFAIGYALGLTFLFIGLSQVAVVTGIITGLASMGLFTGVKTMATK